MTSKLLTLSLLTTLTMTAQSAVIFSDNFEAAVRDINLAPSGWSVASGTVDTSGPGSYSELCNGSGTCVDLDGSSLDAGVLSRSFSLLAGNTYQLVFDLAGNRRNAGTETGTVSFGTASLSYTLTNADPNAAYQQFALDFAPTSSGLYSVTFANAGGDNQGAVLDNVRISATTLAGRVPEPQTLALIAIALAATALVRRRA